jgi:hypothetical protein
MGEGRMEVEYTLLVEDMVAFSRQDARRCPAWARFGALLLWVVGVSLGVIIAIDLLCPPFRKALRLWLGTYYYTSVGFFFGVTVVGVVRVAVLELRFAADAKTIERDQRRAGTQRLTVGPEGLTESSRGSRLEFLWETIPEIVANDRYAFLYFANRQAVVVPRRAFQEQDEFTKFVALVKGYQQAAQPPADEDAPDE